MKRKIIYMAIWLCFKKLFCNVIFANSRAYVIKSQNWDFKII